MDKQKCELKIDWATHEAATYACKNWHYSKCLPTGKLVKIQATENGRFIGVIIYSRGASPFLFDKFDLEQTNGCELTRVALSGHKTPVSKILAISLKFLKGFCPELRLVVSFADPKEGHHGGIYQAGNWVYSGDSNETTEVFLNGKWRHMRGAFYLMNEKTKTRKTPGKHRYLMPLDNEMRAKIEPLRKPYPKRVTSRDNAAPGFQPGEGGANPTVALHLIENTSKSNNL